MKPTIDHYPLSPYTASHTLHKSFHDQSQFQDYRKQKLNFWELEVHNIFVIDLNVAS